MRRAGLFTCHMCRRITHTLPPSVHTFLLISISSYYSLQFFLASASSSAAFSHISVASPWLLFTPVHNCSFSLSFFLPDGQSRGRHREKEWVTSSRASSSRWVAGVQGCLWTLCHNNTKLKRHTHTVRTHKRCTFERLMKPLLQPPTNHLVLWFCSDAFYKHRPGEHGEQVSHILGGSCRRF